MATLSFTSVANTVSRSMIVTNAISKYKENVLVLDQSEEVAVASLIETIRSEELTVSDFLAYVKENATAQEYQSFVSAVELSRDQLSNVASLDSANLEAVMSHVLQMTTATGANYEGDCAGEVFFGTLLLVGAVFLAIEAVNSYDYYYNNSGGFYTSGEAYRQRDEAIIFGVLAAFSGAAGIGLVSTSCL